LNRLNQNPKLTNDELIQNAYIILGFARSYKVYRNKFEVALSLIQKAYQIVDNNNFHEYGCYIETVTDLIQYIKEFSESRQQEAEAIALKILNNTPPTARKKALTYITECIGLLLHFADKFREKTEYAKEEQILKHAFSHGKRLLGDLHPVVPKISSLIQTANKAAAKKREQNPPDPNAKSEPDEEPADNSFSSICGNCKKGGCTMRCQRCLTTYYCSKNCQVTHWPAHKQTCKKTITFIITYYYILLSFI